MSSLSVRFLAPSLPYSSHSNSQPTRPRTRLAVSQTPTAAEPPSAAAEVAVERLEPRVEERDGYWVLREKFRGGINPAEKVKLEREPMKLFVEGGINELAQIPFEEIEKAKLLKDDIDSRLKWLGLFHRRKHQCKQLLLL